MPSPETLEGFMRKKIEELRLEQGGAQGSQTTKNCSPGTSVTASSSTKDKGRRWSELGADGRANQDGKTS